MSDVAVSNVNRDAAAIELTGAQIPYMDEPNAVLVSEVNWRVGVGEFWVVGGRQASGKSSLLLTAAGLNRPAGGTVRIFGQELSAGSEKDQIGWRRRIGFVFENRGRLFSHLTVAQNIALPLQYHPGPDEAGIVVRVDELLTLTGLQHYAGSSPSRLSLGVQQRVGLARALASSPELLFLDNPLSTLSLREGRWWLDFLRRLRETEDAKSRPLTVVASADDFSGWLGVASHFAMVEGGRFRVVGGREQVSTSAEPVVREFLANEI